MLPTPVFFYGMEPGEEVSIDIERGKTLILKFLTVGDPHEDGSRTVFFELNGQPREVVVMDRSARPARWRRIPRPSRAIRDTSARRCRVWWCASWSRRSEQVVAGQKLFTLEAMKMETTIYAERAGKRRRGAGAGRARRSMPAIC